MVLWPSPLTRLKDGPNAICPYDGNHDSHDPGDKDLIHGTLTNEWVLLLINDDIITVVSGRLAENAYCRISSRRQLSMPPPPLASSPPPPTTCDGGLQPDMQPDMQLQQCDAGGRWIGSAESLDRQAMGVMGHEDEMTISRAWGTYASLVKLGSFHDTAADTVCSV
ncbi:hypothetical protein LA080_014787 [Diaporthe eres]|nr:hypothetical protein LA080_014787 [Diaporthe eres]